MLAITRGAIATKIRGQGVGSQYWQRTEAVGDWGDSPTRLSIAEWGEEMTAGKPLT